MSRIYFTVGFGASTEISNLRVDMGKCFLSNLSRYRFLYKEQLKKSRDLKGGFILNAEETQKLLATQSITYPDIEREKHFHPERLRPQMEAQAEASKQKTEEGKPEPALSHYHHKDGTNAIEFAYSQHFVAKAVDCKQGYRTVDKDALLSLRSRYARRFFIYLSGNADCFHFRESVVREMFGLETSYKKKFGSLKRRMECVRKEFGKLGVDFTWEFRRQGSEMLLTIRAKGMEQYHPSVAKEKNAPPRAKELSEKVVKFLDDKLKMNSKEINSNKKNFLDYIYYFGEDGLIKLLSQKMKDPKYWLVHNRIGWLIGAVKGETAKMHATGRVEEKKTNIDNVEVTDPRIREAINRIRNKYDSS